MFLLCFSSIYFFYSLPFFLLFSMYSSFKYCFKDNVIFNDNLIGLLTPRFYNVEFA